MADNSDVIAFDQTTDAALWAKAFCERFGNDGSINGGREGAIDEGLMIGWFANALMRGYDEGYEKGRQEALAEASAAVT